MTLKEYLQNNNLRIQLKFDGLINPSKVCRVVEAYDDHSFPIRKKLTPRLTIQILNAIGFVHSNKHNVGARIWVTVIYQRVGTQYYKHVLAGAPIDNNQELYVEQVPNEELSFNIEDQV